MIVLPQALAFVPQALAFVPQALALVALACLLAAAVSDIRAYEIPDGLSIALLVTALGYGLLTPGFHWLSHITATALMFGIGLLLFARGWMGGGDVKLLVAVAAWAGLSGLVWQLAGVALAGGALALVLIITRRVLANRPAESLPRLFQRDAPVPYAIAIAGGTAWWASIAWPIL